MANPTPASASLTHGTAKIEAVNPLPYFRLFHRRFARPVPRRWSGRACVTTLRTVLSRRSVAPGCWRWSPAPTSAGSTCSSSARRSCAACSTGGGSFDFRGLLRSHLLLEKASIDGAALEATEIRDLLEVVERVAAWRNLVAAENGGSTLRLAGNCRALRAAARPRLRLRCCACCAARSSRTAA